MNPHPHMTGEMRAYSEFVAAQRQAMAAATQQLVSTVYHKLNYHANVSECRADVGGGYLTTTAKNSANVSDCRAHVSDETFRQRQGGEDARAEEDQEGGSRGGVPCPCVRQYLPRSRAHGCCSMSLRTLPMPSRLPATSGRSTRAPAQSR